MKKQPLKFDGKKVYWRLLSYVWPYRLAFLLGILGNILYAAVDASLVKLLEPLLNEGFVSHNALFIRWIPIVLIGIFIVRGVASFLSSYFMGWVGRRVIMNIRQEMFAHALSLPTAYYDTITSGELLSKITYNVEQVANASTDALTDIVRESCTAIALIIVMLSVSWQITLFFIVVVPLMAMVIHVISKRMRTVSSHIQDSIGSVTHVAEQAIEGQKVIKAFGGKPYEVSRFNQVTQQNRRQEMKLIAVSALSIPIVQFIGSIALALMVYLATLNPESLLKTSVTPGGFATIMTAMIALLKPIKQLMRVNNNIQKGLAGAASIFEFLDVEAEQDVGAQPLSQAKGAVCFDHVSFHYHRNQAEPVLNQISFEVKPGETIAIVGRSGGGKSTLVNLLPRFYDATQGNIFIDGINIKDLPLKTLRSQIAIVSQQITLFNDTIANNIAYGRENTPLEEILEAAESAYALEFIKALPQGIHTMIGENGVRLSGGQRQRLAIARAILKKAPILILDEATSALDTESERYIQAALEKLMSQCTTLVIAHRLSTIENANRIIVMDKGQIIEMGTHQELMLAKGLYANLRMMQYHDLSEPILISNTESEEVIMQSQEN